MEFYKHEQSAGETAKKVLLSVIWKLTLKKKKHISQIRILDSKREKVCAICPYLLFFVNPVTVPNINYIVIFFPHSNLYKLISVICQSLFNNQAIFLKHLRQPEDCRIGISAANYLYYTLIIYRYFVKIYYTVWT